MALPDPRDLLPPEGTAKGTGFQEKIIHERSAFDKHDPLTTPEILQVVALRHAALRGNGIPKAMLKTKLTPEQVRLWEQFSLVPALMLQDRLLQIALRGVKAECINCLGTGTLKDGTQCVRCKGKGVLRVAADPRLIKIAHDAAIDHKDRVMGKPTERIQVASAVKVVVGGVDLERLPSAPPQGQLPAPSKDSPDPEPAE